MVGEQPADLVAAEAPPRAGGLRDGDAETVARRGRWRGRPATPLLAASAITRSIAPGSSGLGNDTVGKRRIGLELFLDDDRRVEPGGGERRDERLPPPTPCIAVYATGTPAISGRSRTDGTDAR